MLKRLASFHHWPEVVTLLVCLPYLWQTPITIWSFLHWAALIAQAALLGLAVRVYRAKRSPPFTWLLWACIFSVIARSSWFTLGFSVGILGYDIDSLVYASSLAWSRRVDATFQLLSFLCLLRALSLFVREHKLDATQTSNQAMQRTAR